MTEGESDGTVSIDPNDCSTQVERKNLYEAQKEWAEHAFGELTEE